MTSTSCETENSRTVHRYGSFCASTFTFKARFRQRHGTRPRTVYGSRSRDSGKPHPHRVVFGCFPPGLWHAGHRAFDSRRKPSASAAGCMFPSMAQGSVWQVLIVVRNPSREYIFLFRSSLTPTPIVARRKPLERRSSRTVFIILLPSLRPRYSFLTRNAHRYAVVFPSAKSLSSSFRNAYSSPISSPFLSRVQKTAFPSVMFR